MIRARGRQRRHVRRPLRQRPLVPLEAQPQRQPHELAPARREPGDDRGVRDVHGRDGEVLRDLDEGLARAHVVDELRDAAVAEADRLGRATGKALLDGEPRDELPGGAGVDVRGGAGDATAAEGARAMWRRLREAVEGARGAAPGAKAAADAMAVCPRWRSPSSSGGEEIRSPPRGIDVRITHRLKRVLTVCTVDSWHSICFHRRPIAPYCRGGNHPEIVSHCHFSGNARPRPQVVITRIAVRHEHHLAPRLVEQRSRRRQGRARRRPPPPTPPSTSNLPRTTMGKTKSRRISWGRCRRSTQPRPAVRQRRRDGGIGERRGGKGCDEEGREAEERPSPEGAMRARGEVSVDLQGVQRLSPREAALSVQGVRRVCNLRARSSALSVQGVRWVCILQARSSAPKCKECGGSGICEHARERSRCKECGGASICEHGRIRSQCKECGGASSTVVSARSARSAAGLKSASTIVYALSARSAVGHQSGARSSALSARSAAGHQCEHGRQRFYCKECGGLKSASTIVYALGARSARNKHLVLDGA